MDGNDRLRETPRLTEGSDFSGKDQPIRDGDSANSFKRLILEVDKKKSGKVSPKGKTASPVVPADRPTFRGPFGISITATVIWYVCICILFVIAFISLILSILYFVESTTSEQVIKLYGISGAGLLTIITFLIIFLDCCNSSSQKDHEQEALYRAFLEKEERDRALASRRRRRIAEGKEAPLKPFNIEHHRPIETPSESRPSTAESLPPPHVHHIQMPPPTSYHHPFVCPICHDLHASGNARHNFADASVDTSDKFLYSSKKNSNRTVIKSTRDAQTEPKLWDAEQGTQTDRNEGTQTSAMELSGMPGNITQVIHETTIIKAPRSLLPTLKQSMQNQDRETAVNRAVTDGMNIKIV